MSGLKLAALCGFYPHKLGFCGLQENSAKKTLLSYLAGEKISEQKIRKILETFKGAFFYYKLIAKSNGIKDPFDEKVVKAYWIGNQLLEKVPVDSLKKMIIKEFVGPGFLSKVMTVKKASEISLTSKAHHSFHVLLLGPVTKNIKFYDKLYDLCLISWGRVLQLKAKKSKAVVNFKPLILKNNQFLYGKKSKKEIIWNKTIVPDLQINDQVSFHWNFLCQKLTETQATNLKNILSRILIWLMNSAGNTRIKSPD